MHTHCDDRGRSLLSIYDHLPELPGQFNASILYAGVIKAWHRHRLQTDHWTVPAGNLKVGLFNAEAAPLVAELVLAGPTPGSERRQSCTVAPNSGYTLYLGEHRPGVLSIPPGLWHGGVATGGRDAVLLYYVTRKYDPANPDEERRDWNAFPFAWEVEFK